ncbi:MAG TPA: efflux RND transporter periplasmic adaptor subunit [Vicinamibacterales bacterium]|nr:efflux RND transporter periplasmic adaptor subunit [Vicinamibacterales bacterium]
MTELKDDLAALRIERAPVSAEGGRRWVAWVVLLVLLAGGGYAVYAWLNRVRPAEVEAVTVTERAAGTQASVLNASGYVTARRRATISSKVTGKLVEVNVEEGMAVRQGQVLARLDDSTARAGLALANAQLEAARGAMRETDVRVAEAQVTLKRRIQLHTDGFGSQADVDQAKADVDSLIARNASSREGIKVAQRQVELLQTDLDNMIVRAPFSGVAISKDAQAGEMVSPVSAGGGFTRTGICTIVDMNSLEIEVDVNESYINRVRPSQDVMAVLDAYPDFQIPARVITTVPTADRQKATVLVRIGFLQIDPRVLPDMGVKVTFLRAAGDTAAPAAQPMSLVPKSALKTEGQQTVVFVMRPDNTVERRAVRTGGTDGDRQEVIAGLKSGERVVVAPPPAMVDGTKVVVK